ncbi:K02A2.6-like [Cordylochernes scorpioides]|uniref:RNA-directed DNA polymerase n=1 Tax=Cordylochernes scorpioides TaxID=51811 RepID=A0ABY6KLF8_9ARAC|nr:K02A2.6-like [Cordylochernes scorpioides]
MKIIARRYFWWPGIDGNIEDMARECTICQKSANMPPSTISEWTWPEKPWHRLHMDLAGPFMGKMFLVIVDAYTKWLEIFILKEITSKTIIYHLRQVFARFGLPEILVTDNGRQFVSKEFEEFTKMNGIRHTKASPYNPSTNGLAERYVREFKTSLRKNSGKVGLETNLERFLLAQRAFPQTVMKESPAELLMKRRLKTRFSNLMPKMEFKGEVFHDALKKQENFNIGSDVYFQNYAAGPKWKLSTILKLLSCRHYLIGLVLPSTSTETLENHPEMKPSQVGLEIPERKLPDMELAEKPKSTGQDLAPVEDNQSPVAASGEKVPSWSTRLQREKPRLTRQNLAPVGANQNPVAASGEVPSRSPRPQRSRSPPDPIFCDRSGLENCVSDLEIRVISESDLLRSIVEGWATYARLEDWATSAVLEDWSDSTMLEKSTTIDLRGMCATSDEFEDWTNSYVLQNLATFAMFEA